MKILATLILVTIITFSAISQNNVGINTTPDPSAALDVSATSQGLLIPRMTESEMNAIAAPATSLMVFNTTANAFWYWDGSQWVEFRSGTSLWTLSGTAINVADTTYKVGIGTSNPSGKFEVATVKYIGTYGSDIASGGTATASEFFPGQLPGLAFDDSPTTYWSNNGNLPAWIVYDLGSGNEKRVSRYRVAYNSVATNDNSPNDWTFEGSNDAASWIVLDTRTGQGWTSSGIKTYSFSNTTHYRYYRLNITDNKGTTNDFVSVYEMELKEETLTSQSTFLVSDDGTVRITDGNEADGKILVSDASGNANWADGATVNGGGWNVDGNLLSTAFDSVGIGTTTPGAELEVAGHISQTGTGGSVFLGENAGINDDFTNNNNVFVGHESGKANITGIENVAVGFHSLLANSSGWANSAIGSEALQANIYGDFNVAIGYGALKNALYGISNVAIGQSSLTSLNSTNSDNNIAIGAIALSSITTGNTNIAIGYSALGNSTASNNNIAIGYFALSNTFSPENTAIGNSALKSNTTGRGNVAIGYNALENSNIQSYNVAIGNQAMLFCGLGVTGSTEGIQNTAVGYHSLYWNHSGSYNTALGYVTLANNEANKNTAIGDSSNFSNTTGYQNTAIGFRSLISNTDGNQNTAVGVGAFANGSSYSNSTAIGYDANPNASNTITLGNSLVSTIGGYANWSNISDGRFKTNVQENVAGLEFILKLRPVTYNLDMDAIAGFNKTSETMRNRESERLKAQEVQIGFIAQEVETAANELGFDFHGVDKPKNEHSHYGLRYAEFVVPLVKAVQEQQNMIQQQKRMIENLEQENNLLKVRMDRIEKLLNSQNIKTDN